MPWLWVIIREFFYLYSMVDVHDKETRSYNMSRIRSKDTKPEMMVRRFLFANGFRYRLHVKDLPGKPDIVLPKYKTIIFVHGCFWHGHKDCKYFVVPKTRTEWWLNKINGNIANDKKNLKLLKTAGWKVIQLFECSLKPKEATSTLNRLIKKIR
jgi:DNA mismatch endonuclease, patch repair protein